MYGSVDPALVDPAFRGPTPIGDLGDVAARLTPTTSLTKIRKRFTGLEKDVVDTAKRVFSLRDLPVLVLPWVLFAMTMLPIAVMDESLLGYLSLIFTLLLSVGFIVFSQGYSWVVLAWICFVATGLGEVVGQYDRMGVASLRTLYGNSAYSSYDNVLPTQNPDAVKDAIFLTFSDDTHVDFTKSVGYLEEKVWCVAPIVNSDTPDRVGFFAVGTGCCRERGFFDCGDIWNSSKHSGLLELSKEKQSMYQIAAEMASETYGFSLAKNPTFVRWDQYPGIAAQNLTHKNTVIAVTSTVLCFAAVLVSLVILNIMGLRMVKDEPEIVKEITFGFDWYSRQYSKELKLDLLNHRSYWSGVVMYDYVFHIANKHIFLGPLFCHPAHPFSKWERSVVLTINILLIVFPVSAMTVKFGKDSMTRTILVAVLVTVPRNLLKLYLIDLSMEEEEIELEGRASFNQEKVRQVQRYEVIFLGAAIAIAILTGVLCTLYVKAHTDKSIIHVLAENTDGLAFGFVLEFLIDLLMPYYAGPAAESKFCIGFFGRWFAEYEDFNIGKSPPKASPLQPMVPQATADTPTRPPPGGSAQELLSLRRSH